MVSSNGRASLEINSQQKLAKEFLKALSTAHQCMVERSKAKDGSISYQGPSPDEVTLVEMAKNHGYDFVEGNDEMLQIQKKIKNGNQWEIQGQLAFTVVRLIEFTSDRKRMSSLVYDREDKKYKLYCKGADNIIIDRLRRSNSENKQLKDTK